MGSERRAVFGQISDIDLRQLRIFKTVVESGGFATAEVDLNISRPAISIAVSELEKRLGLCLCQRGRAGFSVTDEGKEIYESILQLFTSMETFKSQVNTLHSCLRGKLNIGITDNMITMEHMYITEALAALKLQGPEVQINIRMAPPVEVESGVIEGQLHVGVVPRHRTMPAIDYFPLYEETSFLYCSNKHPLFLADKVQIETVLSADTVVSFYPQATAVKEVEQEFNTTAMATGREGIAFLVLTGAYIGFLPSHFAARWVNEGKLKPLLPGHFYHSTRYVAITRKGTQPNLVVETFLEKLTCEFNSEGRWCMDTPLKRSDLE